MSFEELLEAIRGRVERATDVRGTVQFVVDGDKFIFVDPTATPPVVVPEAKPADCTIKLSGETFADILSGKTSPAMAFMFGKIKVEGSMGVAMAISRIL
ncbi:MAG: SCP2 sterol-binding domain-containing protein [Bacteroidia bacterium]